MTFTERQVDALKAAFKKNGAVYVRGNGMGGAYRRMLERMADDGYLAEYAPFPITLKGLIALRDYHRARWGESGCEAYRLDLEEVEKACAEFPHMVGHLEKKAASNV